MCRTGGLLLLRGVGGRCPSGQREQTVNLPALPTEVRILPSPPGLKFGQAEHSNVLGWSGNSSGGEHQPSKLRVAGSNPVSRSIPFLAEADSFHLGAIKACTFLRPCSSVVERFLGKEEATGSIPVMGSRFVDPHLA